MSDGFLRLLERKLPEGIPAEQFMSVLASLKVKPEIPHAAAVVLGEAVYDFRAAPDYAVCQISLKQTPASASSKARRNQFPIESTPAGFRARRQTFLAGVADGVASYIEGLQPYNNCVWTRRLADLSNLDKHSQLIELLQERHTTTPHNGQGCRPVSTFLDSHNQPILARRFNPPQM